MALDPDMPPPIDPALAGYPGDPYAAFAQAVNGQAPVDPMAPAAAPVPADAIAVAPPDSSAGPVTMPGQAPGTQIDIGQPELAGATPQPGGAQIDIGQPELAGSPVQVGQPQLASTGPITTPGQEASPTDGPVTAPGQAPVAQSGQRVQPGATAMPGSPITSPDQVTDAASPYPDIAMPAKDPLSAAYAPLTHEDAFKDFATRERIPDPTPEQWKAATPEQQKQYIAQHQEEQARQAHDLTLMTPDEQADAYSKMTPDQKLEFKGQRDARLATATEAAHLRVQRQQLQDARDDMDDQKAAYETAQAKSAAVDADSQALSKKMIDAQGYVHNRSIGQTIGDVISAAVGGAASQYTGGRNLGLEGFNKRVEADIDSQKSNIENGWKGISDRRGAIATELARHGDLNRAVATYRMAATQGLISSLDTQLQNFDPHGATAIKISDQKQQAQQQLAQQKYTYDQQVQKDTIEARKSDREDRAEAAATAKTVADTAKTNVETAVLSRKLTGVGSGTGAPGSDPTYKNKSGVFDPLTKTEIMTRAPVTKEQAKEIQGNTEVYSETQNGLARLHAIAVRLDGDKSLAGELSERRKSDDELEYERERDKLIANQIKTSGGRVNTESMEAFKNLIPDLKKIGSAGSTTALLEDAAGAASELYATKSNILGSDPAAVVASHQKKFAPPPMPSPDDDVSTAQAGLAAAAPGSQDARDYQTSLDKAQARVTKTREDKAKADVDISKASVQDRATVLPTPKTLDPKTAGLVDSRNTAAKRLNLEIEAFSKVKAEKAPSTSNVGDRNKWEKDHEQRVAEHAQRVMQHRAAFETSVNAVVNPAEAEAEAQKRLEESRKHGSASRF